VPHMAAGESDRGVWCQCRVDALCCVSAVAAANQGGRPVSEPEHSSERTNRLLTAMFATEFPYQEQ